MNKWEIYSSKIKKKYGIVLSDEDHAEYKKKINKSIRPKIVGVLIGVFILLFIVIGLLLNELPFNEMTFIPLGFVACLIITSGNALTKKVNEAEQDFINEIKIKYGSNSQNIPITDTPYQNTITNVPNILPNQPKPAANCPVCHQLIPVYSNPCPKCGSKLVWK